jgi:hypothetical protein
VRNGLKPKPLLRIVTNKLIRKMVRRILLTYSDDTFNNLEKKKKTMQCKNWEDFFVTLADDYLDEIKEAVK